MKHLLSGNMRLWLRQALLIAITTLVLYVVIDTAFGIFYKPKPYASHIERLHSPSYRGEPYFSERFLTESFTQPGGWLTPEGTRLVLPQEFHGNFFNVDILKPTGLTYRRTINPGVDGEGATTILLLGGSTIYNSEVPDEYTVASQLSAILSKWQGRRYVTINAGVTSASSMQEIERLKMELKAGLHPDIVISYGGVNDVLQGVYFGNPDGVMFENAKRAPAVAESGLKGRVKALMPAGLLGVYRKARAAASGKHIYAAIMTKRRNEGAREIPGHMKDEQRIQSLVHRTREKYFENMQEANNIAKRNGFQFISVLQPNIYSARYANNFEDIKLAAELESRRLPMVDLAFMRAQPGLQGAVDELRDQGVAAYDCSSIFLQKASNIFLDSHHVNSAGNKIIACALASLVVEHSESSASDSNGQLQACEKALGSLLACGQHGS